MQKKQGRLNWVLNYELNSQHCGAAEVTVTCWI